MDAASQPLLKLAACFALGQRGGDSTLHLTGPPAVVVIVVMNVKADDINENDQYSFAKDI